MKKIILFFALCFTQSSFATLTLADCQDPIVRLYLSASEKLTCEKMLKKPTVEVKQPSLKECSRKMEGLCAASFGSVNVTPYKGSQCMINYYAENAVANIIFYNYEMNLVSVASSESAFCDFKQVTSSYKIKDITQFSNRMFARVNGHVVFVAKDAHLYELLSKSGKTYAKQEQLISKIQLTQGQLVLTLSNDKGVEITKIKLSTEEVEARIQERLYTPLL